jgi:hypothetical protein
LVEFNQKLCSKTFEIPQSIIKKNSIKVVPLHT